MALGAPVEAPLLVKPATEPWEFEAIERLNHETFAGEIPQHAPRPEGRLKDRFHEENQYLVALRGEDLVGMIALRDQRPFSLDHKMADLESHLPPHRSACEIRLLAVRPDQRHQKVFFGLMKATVEACRLRGHDLALISGTLRQMKLYRHIGFEPFGPVVGTPEAPFQPMYLRADTFQKLHGRSFEPINFLPGPAPVGQEVRRAMARPPLYHREAAFEAVMEDVKTRLCSLACAAHVQVLVGSGTLANDCVAAQLSLLEGPGLVLSNGEFGDRLLGQASRWGLDFRSHRAAWGDPFDPAELQRQLEGVRWVWAVHGETSTGMLNDLAWLKRDCAARGIGLAMDVVSTLGAMPLDLSGVRFATAASGKALAGYPGLAIVFHDRPLVPSSRLPAYLDLGSWEAKGGVPFTHSSSLLLALREALNRYRGEGPFQRLAEQMRRLRSACQDAGIPLCGSPASASHPFALTLALPKALPASAFGEVLLARGLQLAWHSSYLRERNWIQACLLVPHSEEEIQALIRGLVETWTRFQGGAAEG